MLPQLVVLLDFKTIQHNFEGMFSVILHRSYNNDTAQCAGTTTIAALADMAGITYLASAVSSG